MHSVSLPLELKWGALRLGNIRPFVSAGIYTQTMLGGSRGDVLRLRRMDYGSSLGVGCDFYFRLFKLSPQLTFSYGMGNVLDTDRPDLREDRRIYYTQALERVGTRMILLSCLATIGAVSNSDHQLVLSGKAGRSRWLGRRPRTRAVVMNPVDHPMGGGEGRATGGHPRSRKGIPAKGYRTRSKTKASNKYIVERRKK